MQIQRTIIYFFLLSSGLLVCAHSAALSFSLYWVYRWFDMPMHVLGGFVAALSLHTLYVCGIRIPASLRGFAGTVAFAFAVGSVWELFEIVAGYAGQVPETQLDSLSDLIFDVIGGCVGYIFVRSIQQLFR